MASNNEKRTVDYLPEVFQTTTNKKFLRSTLDQLVQEPDLKQVQGYIGKKYGDSTDTYIREIDDNRRNYQFEPGIVFKENNKIKDAITYPGLLDGLEVKGANVDNHDRLFSSETYSWSPLIEFDKFVNYSEYYWLPTGPRSVDVNASSQVLTNEFDVIRQPFTETYSIIELNGENPPLTLVRGGVYTFTVNQPDNGFFIQTSPGLDGTVSWTDNISNRDILGVSNNGEDNGVITFSVPKRDEQKFYYDDLTDIGKVDIATDERFDDIDGHYLSELISINNIRDLNQKTIVFLNDTPGQSAPLGWKHSLLYDEIGNDDQPYENTEYLDTNEERYQIFKIRLVYDEFGKNPYVILDSFKHVNIHEKFTIRYGDVYNSKSFFKNLEGTFEEIPLLTAAMDTLFYQDENNSNMFGIINLIDPVQTTVLYIDDILGKKTYTSNNGVIFTNGLKVRFRGRIEPLEFNGPEYYVEGVGSGIKLVPVNDLITPEKYTESIKIPWNTKPWDVTAWDSAYSLPIKQDYITINRSSKDLNAWSRSNRWFHSEVIIQTAYYNNLEPDLDYEVRGKRPIIEFESDLRLFNFGTQGKIPINIVDFTERDALSNINGSTGYSIDGYNLVTGSRVVFANDIDLKVRNKIYEVEYVDMNNDGINIINLSLADDADSYENDNILILNGNTQQGTSYSFKDTVWSVSQLKEGINQPPLFDVYDHNGISLSDIIVYPSTSFAGTKLFSYKEGIGTNDPYLGFPLSYSSIGNLSDIVFDNNLYSDSFIYVENFKSIEKLIQNGYIRKYTDRLSFNREIGWTTSADFNHIPQIFNINFKGNPIILDVFPKQGLQTPVVKVFVEDIFITPENYDVTSNDGLSTIITFNYYVKNESNVEIKIISDEISQKGYYQLPENLSRNVFNENATDFTLGTIRNHYINLSQNLIDIEGKINGSNNTRDLGDIDKFGNIILQNSSPLSLVSTFIRTNEYNFFDALKFNSRQYEKFKYQIIDWVYYNNVYDLTPAEILDQAITELNIGKNSNDAFGSSDMIPFGVKFVLTKHEYTAISTGLFTTEFIYDFTKASNKALLVYVDDVIFVKDEQYIVDTDGPYVTFRYPLPIGSKIVFKEYTSTLGASIPNTPTKMGLFQRYAPEKYLDDTYSNPINVIRGHDGSITPAFDDIRDDVLLEFETRIYSNIKVNRDIPIISEDIFQGQFRDTGYTDNEITEMMSPNLLSWLGWNKIDYKTQDYRIIEEKTWNYGKAGSKLDHRTLKGHWRGIYTFYYDTDAPHLHPWEMLGLSEQPVWWENRYGLPPYTSGNKVLWDDLEAGLIYISEDDSYISKQHSRPGLSSVIPVDDEGNLLDPLHVMVGNYSKYDFKSNWKIGDQGPAETAFRRSSAWPFTVQRLMAMTKPAQYFALNADRDRYKFNYDFRQYLLDDRQRLDSREIEIVNNTTPKNSYINWIADYNLNYGYNSIDNLETVMNDTDVNLCYRMAGFTDKNHMKLFADRSSPDSNNGSLLIPDESYNLLLYNNQPFDEVIYSAISIQKVENGFAVSGNSNTDPYFRILQTIPNGNFQEYKVGFTANDATTIRIQRDFTRNVVFIPYGFVFNNIHLIVDFIAGYGKYLETQGLKFNNVENGYEINWDMMTKEFINWNNQGWEVSSVISLNPLANKLEFERDLTVVDSLLKLAVNEQPQDQNRNLLSPKDYVIDRIDNNFSISLLNDSVLGYLNFNLSSTEHLMILDNLSIFNDLMYNPVLGVRQRRIKLYGYISNNWNGYLEAPGFMLNQDNVPNWNSSTIYNKGNLVIFKNEYWSANQNTEPKVEFVFNDWTKIDYDIITKGLISNPATKSQSMINYYDNHTANLETDADLLSLGLTGFRPRPYLSGLDLDDISQVNIYRNMIENKGTTDSLNLFRNVNFNKESTNYDVFENWAVRRSTYGATNSRSYVELYLDQHKLTSNPSLIEIVKDPATVTDANQIIPLKQIFKQSEKNTSENILPLLTEKITDINLPYAGFVDREDIDIATFSLENFSDINNNLDKIIDGTLLWVAKDTKYDWNVYRTNAIIPEIIKILDNLDDSLTVEFNGTHNLSENDIVIIKYFDDQVDGTYVIKSIQHQSKIIIYGKLVGDQTQITDNGVGFVLVTTRFEKSSDIVGTRYDSELFLEDKIWVKSLNEKNVVIKKTLPYTYDTDLQNVDIDNSNTDYGSIVSQNIDGSVVLVSETGNNVVHYYNKDKDNSYIFNNKITAPNNITNFGNAISSASKWFVVGGNGSSGHVTILFHNISFNIIEQKQILSLAGSSGFGSSVVISKNENWIYVGEPENNRVHAYQQVEYQRQSTSHITDGNTSKFSLNDKIIVNHNISTQVIVILNGRRQYPSVNPARPLDGDFYLKDNFVIFTSTPANNVIIDIIRNDVEFFKVDTQVNDFIITSMYMFNNAESVTIKVNNILQELYIDYNIEMSEDDGIIAGTVKFENDLTVDDTIIIKTDTYFKYIDTIADNDMTQLNPIKAGDMYGYKIDTSEDGSELIITAPHTTETHIGLSYNNTGRIYVYDRVVERTVIVDKSITDYPAIGVKPYPGQQHLCYINGTELNPVNFYNYEYIAGVDKISLNYPDISVGDFLDIAINRFVEVQKVSIENYNENAMYGSAVSLCRSKCSIYVGANKDNTAKIEGGSVQRIINMAKVHSIIIGKNDNPIIIADSTIRINRIVVKIKAGSTAISISNLINELLIPNVESHVSDNRLVIELVNKTLTSLVNRLEVLPDSGSAYTEIGFQPYEIGQTIFGPTPNHYAKFGTEVQIDYNMNHLIIASKNGTTHKLVRFDDRTTTFDGRTMRIIDSYINSGAVYSYDLMPDATQYTAGKMAFGQQIYDTNADILTLYETTDTTLIYASSILKFNGLKRNSENIVSKSVTHNSLFGSSISIANGVLMIGSPGHDYPVLNTGRVAIFVTGDDNRSWNILREEQEQVDIRMINSIQLYNKNTEKVIQYLDYIDPLNGKILGVARQNIDYITTIDPVTYNSSTQGILWGEAQLGEIWWDIQNVRFLDYHQENNQYSNVLWSKLFPGSIVEIYQWIKSNKPPTFYEGEGTVKNLTDFVVTSTVENNIVVNTYYYWVKDIREISNNISKTLSPFSIASYIESPKSSGIPYASLIKQNVIGLTNLTGLITELSTIIHIEYDNIKNDNNVFLEFELIRENNKEDFLSSGLYKKFQDSFCGADDLGNLVPDVNLSPGEKYGINFRPRQSMFKNRYKALKSYIDRANTLFMKFTIAENSTYPLLESEESFPERGTGEWDIKVQDDVELSYQNLNLVNPGFRILVENDADHRNFWTIYEVNNYKELTLYRIQYYNTNAYWNKVDWYAPGVDEFTKINGFVNLFNELITVGKIENIVYKVLSNSDDSWELYRWSNNEWIRIGLQNGTIQINETIYDYQIGRFGFDVEVFDTQYFDQEPVAETRNIIRSINEEILVGDLQVDRNKLLISTFNYIIGEQQFVDWLYKTSLLDVTHKVRSLIPNTSYKKDNQDYVFKYIEEVKPYHCKVKDFILQYDAYDLMEGNVTDFDCPSYYDTNFSKFISPILDDGAILRTDPSNRGPDDITWKTMPWNKWYDNRSLVFEGINILNHGSGYFIPPTVRVIGNAEVQAELFARVTSFGEIREIVVKTPGKGYLSTPIIEIDPPFDTTGEQAYAVAITKNSLVRSFDTSIKFDRYEYVSSVNEWIPGNILEVNDKVRYNNQGYVVIEANSDITFKAAKYLILDIKDLSGIDRTMGFYVPDVNKPGLDMSLLMKGITYPGVDVHGLDFDADDGWDSDAGWDIPWWDQAERRPDSDLTYALSLLDTVYESKFPGPKGTDNSNILYSIEDYSDTADSYVGSRPTDTDITGGQFIDTYHSHAPEELIPGSTFDTLDIKTLTRPNWKNGNAFAIDNVTYLVTGDSTFDFITADTIDITADSSILTNDLDDLNIFYEFSLAGISQMPITVLIYNMTLGRSLYEIIDYDLDWNNKKLTITNGVDTGHTIKVTVSGIGGGDQLYRKALAGSQIINDSYIIPVRIEEIRRYIIFANGIELRHVDFTALNDYNTKITFFDTFTDDAIITITILGYASEFNENLYQVNTFEVGGVDDALFNKAFFNEATFVDSNNTILEYILPEGTVEDITAQMNAVVELEGARVRSPEGIRYTGIGTETDYALSITGDSAINSTGDVVVIINGNQLTYSIDYIISPIGGFDAGNVSTFNVSRFNVGYFAPEEDLNTYIRLTIPLEEDAVLEIYTITNAGYDFVDNELKFRVQPTQGSKIGVVTYGDTHELQLLTEVFQGPTQYSRRIAERWDQIHYDQGLWNQNMNVETGENIFELTQTTDINIDRLWITLNGIRLDPASEYLIVNNLIFLYGDVIKETDVVIITSMTNAVLIESNGFRYFKDMRNNRAMFEMSSRTSTYLTQPVLPEDDIIHVKDVSKLGQPVPTRGIFGIVTINGERITYREVNISNNTLSGLRRGTAGTGASDHYELAIVSDLSKKSLIQDTEVSGEYDSALLEPVKVSSDDVTSLISITVDINGIIDDVIIPVPDTMYVENLGTLCARSWKAVGWGKVLLGDFIIQFTEKNLVDKSISGLTVYDLNGNLVDPDSSINYPSGTSLKDMAPDLIWYESFYNKPDEDMLA